ncbi:MAG: heparan-alpha-glucosaminide N-acetyltransferase domain-containing protein [Candidatus Korobacteraceae bacterium]
MDFRPQSIGRIEAIDLVRLVAMALMIEGHTLDALLDPQYRNDGWYHLWLFCRGFTAPTFMLLSGFSFAFATIKRWEQNLSLNSVVLRRLRRFVFFILLGYVMHLPVHSLRTLGSVSQEQWRGWLQVDVLQSIGVSLLLLQFLVFVARTPARFLKVSLGLSAGLVAVAPIAWAGGWGSHLPALVGAYLDGSAGSLFPLLPWAAYTLFGAALGCLYLGRSQRSPQSGLIFGRVMFLIGLAAMSIGFGLEQPALAFFGPTVFWSASPTLFLIRAGFVLFLLGGMLLVHRFASFSSGTVRSLAQESLLVYFLHVVLLYGSIWNTGLRDYIAGLAPLQALGVAILVGAGTMGMALAWNRLKTQRPTPVLAFRTVVLAAAVISIL